MNRNDDIGVNLIIAALLLVLMFFITVSANTCSESDWNNGICPKCNVRYELRGVSRGYVKEKYYVCPECGKEVERY